jgi:hypothetical protein
MKVTVHFEWPNLPEKTSKLSIPRSWVEKKKVADVIELFVDAYNGKNPDSTIDKGNVHLATAATLGDKVVSDGKIDESLEDRMDYYICEGPFMSSHVDTSAVVDDANAGKLRCKNYGCGKYYTEEENVDGCCKHHVMPPFFHDTIKGWQCCRDKKAFDWEEFQLIEGCSAGKHSQVAQASVFAASPTVAAADKAEAAAPLKTAADYNAANPEAASAAKAAERTLVRKSSRNADGTARCQNKGCGKTFTVAENSTDACVHHSGQAVFHDTMKYWSCCPNAKKMDFDDFMAVPGCTTGWHDDGVIDIAQK